MPRRRSGADLACCRIDNLHRQTGIVDKQALASLVPLTHDDVERAAPSAIQISVATVVIPVGVGGLVLLPQQNERHALAAQLLVHALEVRCRARDRRWCRRGKQQVFEGLVIELLRQRPTEAGILCAEDIVIQRAASNADGSRHLSATELARTPEPEQLSDLSHGYRMCGHRSLPL